MPLFELDDGPVRTFTRIEREGCVVSVTSGRSGSSGATQATRYESEEAARKAFQGHCAEQRERGATRIHEAEPKSGARAPSPRASSQGRLVLVHKGLSRFAWLWLNDKTLLSAEGKAGSERAAIPESRAFESALAARTALDRAAAALLRRGFVVDERRLAAAPVKTSEAPGRLLDDAALVRSIAEAPEDEASWVVLEDFLVSEGDARRRTIEHERAGAPADAAEARGAILTLLLGPRAEAISKLLSETRWRAGFLRAARFTAETVADQSTFAPFAAAPATRLLTTLELRDIDFQSLPRVGASAFAPLLSTLRLRAGFTREPLDLGALARCVGLTSLSLGAVRAVVPHPLLDRIVSFGLCPGRETDLEALLGKVRPRLTILTLDLSQLGAGSLAPLLPRMERGLFGLSDLTLVCASPREAEKVLAVLAESPVLGRLRALEVDAKCESAVVPAAFAARELGPGFAHLSRLELPAGLVAAT